MLLALALPSLPLSGAVAQAEVFPNFEETTRLDLTSLASFNAPAQTWRIGGGVANDPFTTTTISTTGGSGVLVHEPKAGRADSLATTWEHGDLDLELDFMLAQGARPALFLQGRYRLELAEIPGGALRAPGLWQHLRLVFRAPRFSAEGTAVSPAQLLHLELNESAVGSVVTLQRASDAPLAGEAARGPLFFGGTGGAAFRGVSFIPRVDHRPIQLGRTRYRFFEGVYRSFDAYEKLPPTQQGTAEAIRADLVSAAKPYALVFTGELRAPVSGKYFFHLETEPYALSQARLKIDDHVVPPAGSRPGDLALDLTAGVHRFELDYIRGSLRGGPDLVWLAAGPQTHPHALVHSTADVKNRPLKPILVEARDTITVQRCFLAHPSGKKTRVIAVGSPQGVHFACDLATGALLAVWRGDFLDTSGMWHERGFSQEGKAAGPTLWLSAPAFAAAYRSLGYEVAANGVPTFLARAGDQPLRDTCAVSADGRALLRTLEFPSGLTAELRLVLAATPAIVRVEDRYAVGDRSYYVKAEDASDARVSIQANDAGQTLVATLPKGTTRFSYSILW